jgi:anti-sigma regulatory factor (Ser/Thr protein kinase)
MARLFLLPAKPGLVSIARWRTVAEAILATLTAGLPPALLDLGLVALVASELISNAVRHGTSPVVRGLHGGPRVLVRIRTVAAGIEIAVTDNGTGTGGKPHAGPMPDQDSESGRGLALVQALTGYPVRAEQLASGKWQVTALVPWRQG